MEGHCKRRIWLANSSISSEMLYCFDLHPQWSRGQARLHLGPTLQHLSGPAGARRRCEFGGIQPSGSGAAAVRQRRLHHQGVALAADGPSGSSVSSEAEAPQPPAVVAHSHQELHSRRQRERKTLSPGGDALREVWSGMKRRPPSHRSDIHSVFLYSVVTTLCFCLSLCRDLVTQVYTQGGAVAPHNGETATETAERKYVTQMGSAAA